MTATLTSLSTRVSQALMDADGLIWDAAAMTEAIRSALQEYNLVFATDATLSGLDSASSTSLPANHELMLVTGAAGYAALARSADRAESFQLGAEARDWQSWGLARLDAFRALLKQVAEGAAEKVRRKELRESTNPAWGTYTEEF